MNRNAAPLSILVSTFAITITLSTEAIAGCSPSVVSDPAYNTCIGTQALSANGSNSNTAVGTFALSSNTVGSSNTAIGSSALQSNTKGSNNSSLGMTALYANTLGSNNTAMGELALFGNTTGLSNTASGYAALVANTEGAYNVALGYQAGSAITTGSNNVAIANVGTKSDAGIIRIGTAKVHKKTFVAGISGINVTRGQSVVINSSGQLGVSSSSRRYKDEIKPMGDASNPLKQLRPVTFHYKQAEQDGSKPLQYGLIAEEVAEVMPDLVVYNEDGTPESVAYQVLPSLLLNEYQKQNQKLMETQMKLSTAEERLEAVEAEMAAMKLMLSKLASAQSGQLQLANAP